MTTSYDAPASPNRPTTHEARGTTYARLLAALAAIYLADPHLPMLRILASNYGSEFELQQAFTRSPAADLITWAELTGAHTLHISWVVGDREPWAQVELHGHLDGVDVRIWDRVPELAGSGIPEGTLLTVAQLAETCSRVGDGFTLADALRAVLAESDR